MSFSLLLDEMTEASLAEYCRNVDHDVERVVDASELGRGSDDAALVADAERENHILVTYDDDFLVGHDALDRIGVFFAD
jgi:predicted nuclease of predicted toxin-antitoxin system